MSPGSGGQRATGAQTLTVRTASGRELAYPWATSVRVDRQGNLRVLQGLRQRALTLAPSGRVAPSTTSAPRYPDAPLPRCTDAPMPLWYCGTATPPPSDGRNPMVDERKGLLELDSRRRISLGSLARHDRYLVDVEEDGTIVLTPAVVMSVVEARLHAATETSKRIDEFLDNPETGVRRSRPRRARLLG